MIVQYVCMGQGSCIYLRKPIFPVALLLGLVGVNLKHAFVKRMDRVVNINITL